MPFKYYNGSAWVEPAVKRWSGTAWDDVPIKYYNGTAWDTIYAAVALALSGETVSAFNFQADARAEVWIDANGNMYKRVNGGTSTQIDTGTDWIRPTSSAGLPYRARYTGLTGDALSFASAAQNTWRGLNLTFSTEQLDSSPALGGTSSTFTLEIDDGSVLQTSGSYTLSADREDF